MPVPYAKKRKKNPTVDNATYFGYIIQGSQARVNLETPSTMAGVPSSRMSQTAWGQKPAALPNCRPIHLVGKNV